MSQFVFQDKTGKRWRMIKGIFLIGCIFLCVLILLFFLDYYQIITIPRLQAYLQMISPYVTYVLASYLLFATLVGFTRLFILLFYSTIQWYMKKAQNRMQLVSDLAPFKPLVTVIVPVYNEEVVIEKTLTTLLRSSYPIDEILVIDDGSTDQTATIVREKFGHLRKIEFIQKKNGGKASVLNLGFQLAIGEIIVTIDADTNVTEQTIAHLIIPFRDPSVAAVSGNCRIGNVRNQLTLWQHLEYVTINNLERRACEILQCMMVVPGSNSAWRKKAVKEVGYFETDTLAEDTDLTIKLINRGYDIIYANEAVTYEECPENVKAFVKQRFRWSFGILQSAWKHKRNILQSENKIIKYFAGSMIFSYFLFLTAPLIDLIFIYALLTGSKTVFIFALLFYVSDVLAPAYALKLEKVSMKPLKWVFVQRLAYRYLIAFVTWKTVLTALKGREVGWRKLKRTGNHQQEKTNG